VQRILAWENPALYIVLFMMLSGRQWKAQLGEFNHSALLLFAEETV